MIGWCGSIQDYSGRRNIRKMASKVYLYESQRCSHTIEVDIAIFAECNKTKHEDINSSIRKRPYHAQTPI